MYIENRYVDLFTDLGLLDKEALVYNDLLINGGSTAGEIHKKLNITRTNTYQILEKLIELGLVSRNRSSSKIVYHAEHPQAVLELVEERKNEVTQLQNQVEALVDDMVADYTLSKSLPGVFRFEGKEGLYRVYEDLVKDKLPLRSIQSRGTIRKIIPEYNEQFLKGRMKNNIFHTIISVAPEKDIEPDFIDSAGMREVKYIPSTRLKWDMDVKMNDKKVSIATFSKDNTAGIVIADKEVARNFRVLFEYMWSKL